MTNIFLYITSIVTSRKKYLYSILICSTNTRIEPRIVGLTFISQVHFPYHPLHIVDQFLCRLSSSFFFYVAELGTAQ